MPDNGNGNPTAGGCGAGRNVPVQGQITDQGLLKGKLTGKTMADPLTGEIATIGIGKVETIDPLAETVRQETALTTGIRRTTGKADPIGTIGTIAQADRDKTEITDVILDPTEDRIVAETIAEDLV